MAFNQEQPAKTAQPISQMCVPVMVAAGMVPMCYVQAQTPVSPAQQQDQIPSEASCRTRGLKNRKIKSKSNSPHASQQSVSRSDSGRSDCKDLAHPSPSAQTTASNERTTVMFRNLPERFSRADMLHLLDSKGFHGLYDFVYLPFDFDTLASLRYAFVNMMTPSDTEHLWEVFDGFSDWPAPCENVCVLAWNEKQQGLSALLERYRNSPVMHGTVPEEGKPLVLRDGEEVPFPAPTRLVQPPKTRNNKTNIRG